MRRVIVNSTPLIALCNAGLLKLLKEIYGTITIPRAVFDEVTAKQDSACTQIKDNLDWITVEEIKDIADRKMYKAKLHEGEVDVMILAQSDPTAGRLNYILEICSCHWRMKLIEILELLRKGIWIYLEN